MSTFLAGKHTATSSLSVILSSAPAVETHRKNAPSLKGNLGRPGILYGAFLPLRSLRLSVCHSGSPKDIFGGKMLTPHIYLFRGRYIYIETVFLTDCVLSPLYDWCTFLHCHAHRLSQLKREMSIFSRQKIYTSRNPYAYSISNINPCGNLSIGVNWRKFHVFVYTVSDKISQFYNQILRFIQIF